jgi:hypothetical protein
MRGLPDLTTREEHAGRGRHAQGSGDYSADRQRIMKRAAQSDEGNGLQKRADPGLLPKASTPIRRSSRESSSTSA